MTTLSEPQPSTLLSPVHETAVPVPGPRIDRAELAERARIDASTSAPVLIFFTSAIAWLLLSTGLGIIAALKLHWPGFLSTFSFLTYGRIYPAYTNAFTYG